MSISVGLTGWGDHHSLYLTPEERQSKLYTYSAHFPVVEVDSSFYAVQPTTNYQKWVEETPEAFRFVIKATQNLTGHDRKPRTNKEMKQLVEEFKQSIVPVRQANKLKAVLFQFPPWFNLKANNIQKIKKLKEWMGEIPLAIEFRNQTWFTEESREQTITFLQTLGVTHVICDEPQAGEGSVPLVLATTNDHVLIRFHGRNIHGWNNHGQENWREVRFLYRYNEQELMEWVEHIRQLQQQTKDITILFNNNSGGDAADNAKQFIDLLGIQYQGLHPKQMDLFDL
ncbi:DUF72 domain-containing protein [Gracilibacillus phocaeensis]|uniref:DUF72 domain-containing protein n=1 Tax=Gracilibacillus phocaeensis TaxID=2042304 RepID=UPI00102FBA7D|nr:DUF72 domain-containing protein [Gracilibacillus phocaeensis]